MTINEQNSLDLLASNSPSPCFQLPLQNNVSAVDINLNTMILGTTNNKFLIADLNTINNYTPRDLTWIDS